tara:strand:- start:377 stop:511 length:135 start_codon:yes stop_codon:yes gene_type:complete
MSSPDETQTYLHSFAIIIDNTCFVWQPDFASECKKLLLTQKVSK